MVIYFPSWSEVLSLFVIDPVCWDIFKGTLTFFYRCVFPFYIPPAPRELYPCLSVVLGNPFTSNFPAKLNWSHFTLAGDNIQMCQASRYVHLFWICILQNARVSESVVFDNLFLNCLEIIKWIRVWIALKCLPSRFDKILLEQISLPLTAYLTRKKALCAHLMVQV